MLIDTLSPTLAHPLFAGGLGLVLGVALLLFSRASFRLLTPEEPGGLALVAILLFARMGFVVVALYAYRRFVPAGFNAFAATFAAGFFVTYWIELVRYAGLLKSRPRAVSRQG